MNKQEIYPEATWRGYLFFFTGYELKAGSHLQKAVFWCMIHAEGSAHKMWRKEAE